ncbi:hypothetical protein B0O80DRAFT_107985 [Mortierella sp. GBAus27b]|nr:hypothetical protein B0O80DRAFT_107985 [Mortierella sp. GBAus27b]
MLHPVSSSTLPLPVPASSPAKSSSSSSSPARLSSSFPSALTPPRQLPTLLLAKEHPLLVQDYTTHRSDQPSPLSHIRSDCKASSERPLAISLNLERPSLLSLHPTAFTFETPFSGLSFSQRPTLLSGHHKLCRSPAQSEDRSSRNGNRDRIEKGNDFGNNRIDHENTGGYNTSEATLNHDADEDTTAPHPALQTTTTTTSSMSATHIDQCPLLPSLLVAGVTKRPVPQCRSLSNMDVQCTRPKPKPSPIATRLHVGTKVAAKGDKDGHTTLASACENTLSGAMNNLLMCGERSTDACDQDSGIALEPWDDPCSQLDIVQEHGIQKKHCEQAENVRAFELPGNGDVHIVSGIQ